MAEADPPDLDVEARLAGITSYTVVRKSDEEVVRRGLEQAGKMELGRETTAVAKLCTVLMEDPDESWALCTRSGRVVGARRVRVPMEGETTQDGESRGRGDQGTADDDADDEGSATCLEIVVYDFLTG